MAATFSSLGSTWWVYREQKSSVSTNRLPPACSPSQMLGQPSSIKRLGNNDNKAALTSGQSQGHACTSPKEACRWINGCCIPGRRLQAVVWQIRAIMAAPPLLISSSKTSALLLRSSLCLHSSVYTCTSHIRHIQHWIGYSFMLWSHDPSILLHQVYFSSLAILSPGF